MKAAILVGGYGKRLRPLTDDKPKSLLELAGKPILVWQVEWLKRCGVDEMILCVGYLKEKIMGHVGKGDRFGLKVGYAVEESPLGTGGALRNAEALLKNEDRFLVVNGDIITDLDPARMASEIGGSVGIIALVPLKSPFGIVDTDKEGFARRFREKPIIPECWINAGVYCFKSEIFDYLPQKGNIETVTFPKLARESKLKAFKYKDVFWKSIETQKDMEEAEASLKATQPS